MSKRNSDGDVLTNRLNLGLAKHQKLLASWMGSPSDTDPVTEGTKPPNDDEDLKVDYGHDRYTSYTPSMHL